jgi:hypothetical protein
MLYAKMELDSKDNLAFLFLPGFEVKNDVYKHSAKKNLHNTGKNS